MCWWVQFSKFISSEDHCRNISALFFQQYKLTAKHALSSIKRKHKIPIPHTIDHDERCDFVAILAIIIDEPPEDGFEECFVMAEKLKHYVPNMADIEEAGIIAESVVLSLTAKKDGKEYPIGKDLVIRVHMYIASIVAAIKLYLATGPTGSFGPQYLLEVLK
jgi:hypothetical protein